MVLDNINDLIINIIIPDDDTVLFISGFQIKLPPFKLERDELFC